MGSYGLGLELGLRGVWMDVTLSDSTFSLPCDVPMAIAPFALILDELQYRLPNLKGPSATTFIWEPQ